MCPGEGTVAAERFTQSADLRCPRDLCWGHIWPAVSSSDYYCNIERQMDVLILADDIKETKPPNIQWKGPVKRDSTKTTYPSLSYCWEM